MSTGADRQAFGRVAVLMGGWSAEREVSLKSGGAVLEALRGHGIDALAVDVQSGEALLELLEAGVDRAFIALHGRGGEDGSVQGALEVLGIPYTGSGVLASALAMDKLRCKQFFDGVSLPTPPFMVMDAEADHEFIAASLGLPLMVKPALEGSSIGLSRVEHVGELADAWQAAARYPGPVLAEKWIEGEEYTVAILGEEALPVIRVETPHAFYDYSAKYEADSTQYHCPAGLAAAEEQQMQRLALAAFRAVGGTGWGRVDLMRDSDGVDWIIEINTVPGMTDHSLVPMAARARGMAFDELVLAILRQTLEKDNGNGDHGEDERHARTA